MRYGRHPNSSQDTPPQAPLHAKRGPKVLRSSIPKVTKLSRSMKVRLHREKVQVVC